MEKKSIVHTNSKQTCCFTTSTTNVLGKKKKKEKINTKITFPNYMKTGSKKFYFIFKQMFASHWHCPTRGEELL